MNEASSKNDPVLAKVLADIHSSIGGEEATGAPCATSCARLAGPYLRRSAAAAYITARLDGAITITEDQLASKARTGNGPPYRLWGDTPGRRRGGRGCFALYAVADLDVWIESQLDAPSQAPRTFTPSGPTPLSTPSTS